VDAGNPLHPAPEKGKSMNKKIMLLALGAFSAMMLAAPAMASAITPLHLNPTPAGSQTIDANSFARLSTTGGTMITCNGFSGSATFETGGTTGTMHLQFGGGCTTNLGGTCTNEGLASSFKATALPIHLATVQHSGGVVSPGVLVTRGANEHIVTFTCHNVGGFLTVDSAMKANGVIGTITGPGCGARSKQITIVFQAASNGIQTHKKVAGTATEYSLKKGSENAALEAHATITLSTESDLVCT
jgi:hypothetical protein